MLGECRPRTMLSASPGPVFTNGLCRKLTVFFFPKNFGPDKPAQVDVGQYFLQMHQQTPPPPLFKECGKYNSMGECHIILSACSRYMHLE